MLGRCRCPSRPSIVEASLLMAGVGPTAAGGSRWRGNRAPVQASLDDQTPLKDSVLYSIATYNDYEHLQRVEFYIGIPSQYQ